jgi:hypothetical protein
MYEDAWIRGCRGTGQATGVLLHVGDADLVGLGEIRRSHPFVLVCELAKPNRTVAKVFQWHSTVP